MATLTAELFRRKPVVEMEAESGSEREESELSRSLDWITLLVFLVWTAIVIAWYFPYGRKHSHLGRHEHVGLIKDEPVV